MRDFEDSTLWRVSEYDRVRSQSGGSAFARLAGATVLPTTLLAELRGLDLEAANVDPVEVVAACMRHREPALLCLQYDGLVWPVTLFPNESLYHSPRDFAATDRAALARLSLLTIEPPGVRPLGHWMHDRVAQTSLYRPLAPLLWTLTLDGPREHLLAEISGTAAYRAVRDVPDDESPALRGVMRSAAQRLRRDTVALRDIAGWPGMTLGRATRLLNGLYLNSALLATRAHPAARGEPRPGWSKSRR